MKTHEKKGILGEASRSHVAGEGIERARRESERHAVALTEERERTKEEVGRRGEPHAMQERKKQT